jgi:hypothetical protein
MKEGKSRPVILLCKGHFGERVRGGSGKPVVAIIVQDLLKICPSARWAIEISIAFTEGKIGVRPAGVARVIIQIFLIPGTARS